MKQLLKKKDTNGLKIITIKDNLESVNIAELKNQNVIVSVPKSQWKGGLENAMDYYIEKEEYEECSKIKKLIEKL